MQNSSMVKWHQEDPTYSTWLRATVSDLIPVNTGASHPFENTGV